MTKDQRRKIINDIMLSLQRGTPIEVLQRKLIHEIGYSLSGVNTLIKEARFQLVSREESHNNTLDFE